MRQAKLTYLLANLADLANNQLKNSEITRYLQRYDTQTLILAATKSDEKLQRRSLWNYLTNWQLVKSPLNGADLKQIGYATGKQMGEMLQQLRWLALDGEIQTKEEAIAYLQTNKSPIHDPQNIKI